ncbi:MAG: FAD-dependent oxidoreductase, partial [Actinomycetota bacterium]|nr:FAD-dependent oxidoreductase [Actinomycetota bacterium]
MSNDSSVRPLAANEVTRWDGVADVVVVGCGCAGASAAFEAAAAGADVLILERAGGAGGASAIAGGELYLGGGTPVQTACGFEDSAEDMFKFLMAACGPDADEAKVSMYSERSLEHFHWLVDRGVPFKHSLWSEPAY